MPCALSMNHLRLRVALSQKPRDAWETGEPGPARRVYRVTRSGQRHLKEWAQVSAKVAGSMNRFVLRVSSDKSQ